MANQNNSSEGQTQIHEAGVIATNFALNYTLYTLVIIITRLAFMSKSIANKRVCKWSSNTSLEKLMQS